MSWKLAFFLYVGIDLVLTAGLFHKRQIQNAKANHPSYVLKWTTKDTDNSKYPYNQEIDDKFLKIINDYKNL